MTKIDFSRFNTLVEVAVKLANMEKVAAQLYKPSDSKEEERVDFSFLDRVPRKRRSSLTNNRSYKKAKVNDLKTVPFWLEQVIEKLEQGGEGVYDLKLIFEKTLYKTDIESSQGRLSLPSNKLIRSDFLTSEELGIIGQDIGCTEKIGVRALVVDQRCQKWEVMLKRWELKKQSGKGSWSYVLSSGWNKIVKDKELKVGDRFSVWSFRWKRRLCFALVPPHPSRGNRCFLPQ